MPASMPTSNSPYPTAPLALLIDNDHKSIHNNCNGAVSESTTSTLNDTSKLSYRNPTECSRALSAGEKLRRKENKMNLQVVCITVTLVICCIVITGLEVWNSMQTWKLQTEIDVLHVKLATLQTNFDQLKNSTTNFVGHLNISRSNNRPPLHGDPQWMDQNRNASDEEYEEDYVYDDEEPEYNDNEGEDIGRNGSIGGSVISSRKQSFDSDTADYADAEDRKSLPALPLSEDEFDATVTEPAERNETVKRTSRSVSPGDNGIPVIDGTYAENRKTIDDAHEAVDGHEVHRLNENQATGPRFQHDWSDRSGSIGSRKYPKKYESSTDDLSASASHRHRHRHHQERQVPPTSTGDDAWGPMPATIDLSNLFSSPRSEQDKRGDTQLNLEIMRHTNAYQPKPRRRKPPPPPQPTPAVRAARSPMHQAAMRFKTIAVHYQGDTSAYMNGGRVLPHHLERFDGNGRVRHPGGVYSDWKPADWVDDHAMDRFFAMHQGVVTVKEHGLYYIYAQIFYHDDHDTNGYIVEHNSEPLYQCTTATHSNQRVTKSNTCHTAGINYLNAGDRIHIKDLGSHRYTLFDASKSFFGLIKVGDLRGGSGGSVSTSSSAST